MIFLLYVQICFRSLKHEAYIYLHPIPLLLNDPRFFNFHKYFMQLGKLFSFAHYIIKLRFQDI